MKPGYSVVNRGLWDFNRIIVFNWPAVNEVDNMKWNNTPLNCSALEFVVAIFKIKMK
jgi:hypothetical protein